MFFPERIQSIRPGDRVLDVGPGADPHPRADVLLERNFSEAEAEAQRGHTPLGSLKQKTVFFDGGRFPFADGEFDYVICSHVLEHVEDPCEFIAELVRVAKSGYLEYPTAYYEYLHNFRVHRNILHHSGNEILWMRKDKTPLDVFLPVQQFFLEALRSGYDEMIVALRPNFAEGFEWVTPPSVREVSDIGLVCPEPVFPPNPFKAPPVPSSELAGELLSRIKRKLFR
ncbi:MAG: methyltransferase domain-containing protein [Verrucomicrobiota bacterium]